MSSNAKHGRCAECAEPLPARDENAFFPFCSKRCKDVDLSRWFNEEYALPVSQHSTERDLPDDDTMFEQ